jgi:hypothetical protein
MSASQQCYSIKTLNYNDGLFDESVDATYIIHLEGNGRESHILEELGRTRPTNKVHIVYNKGFRKCDKGDKTRTTWEDLTHTYLWIFKHALSKNYANILILEDDFMFVPEIHNLSHIQNINEFVKTHCNNDFVYLLGCLPTIALPYDFTNYLGVITTGMHSVIYSKKCMENTLAFDNVQDWDAHFTLYSKSRTYLYYKPLCYQLFPHTENKLNWGNENFALKILAYLFKFIINALSLYKSVEPGYSIFYAFSKIGWIFFVGILIIAIVFFKNGKLKLRRK